MTWQTEQKIWRVVFAFFGALFAFCLGGMGMCIAYGGTWTTDARPAPWWTLLIVIGPALIVGFLVWAFDPWGD